MQQAAIYVRDPLTKAGNIISKEDQETACRAYCLAKDLTVAATFADQARAGDQFDAMIAQATGPAAPFDAIVSGSFTASPPPSRRPSSTATGSGRPAPSCSQPQNVPSTTDWPPDPQPRQRKPQRNQPAQVAGGAAGPLSQALAEKQTLGISPARQNWRFQTRSLI